MAILVGLSLTAANRSRGAETSADTNGATKACFNCKGTGEAPCAATGCRKGRVECPAPCLRLSRGVWEKREVPGHTDPNERWQRVRINSRQSAYISSGHLGQYYQPGPDGTMYLLNCPTCTGLTTLPCSKCKGKGTLPCSMCDSKKVVPASWSAFDNPRMKDRPKRFELKDGRVLIGRSVAILDTSVKIRTEKGDVTVEKSDIVSEKSQPTQP